MNKKGFTLPELLAVIVVLAIVITIGTMSALTLIKRADKKLTEENRANIEDAALMYFEDLKYEKDYNKKNDFDANFKLLENGTYKLLYTDLVNSSYLSDDKKLCNNPSAYILITKIKTSSSTVQTDFSVNTNNDYEAKLMDCLQ